METIGERIRYARKHKKLTLKDLTSKTAISTGNLSDLENNKSIPSSTAAISLSRELGVSIDWILIGEGRGPDDHDPEDAQDKFLKHGFITTSVGTGKSLSILNLLTPEIKKSILLLPPPNKQSYEQALGRVNRTDLDNAVLKHLGVQDFYNDRLEPNILDGGPPDHKMMVFYSGVYDRINYLMSRNSLHSLDLLNKAKEILGPDMNLNQKDILNIMDGYCIPDNYVLYAIARVLKVTPGWILYGDDISDSNIRSNTNHNFEDARRIRAVLYKTDLPLDIIAKRLKISLYDLYEHMDGVSISKGLIDNIAELCKVSPEWLTAIDESDQPGTNRFNGNSDDQQNWTGYMAVTPETDRTEVLLSTFNEDMKQSLKAIVRNYINEMIEKGITSKEELLDDKNVSAILNDIIIDEDDELDQRMDSRGNLELNNILDDHEMTSKKYQSIVSLLKNIPEGALEETERYIQYIIFRLENNQSKEEQAVTKKVESA